MSDAKRFELSRPDLPGDVTSKLAQISAEHRFKLLQFGAEQAATDLAKTKELVKDIDGFWGWAITQHQIIKAYTMASSDQHALSFLTDIELKQDVKDPRPFELVFHFKENPYFSNSSLSKKYSLPSDLPSITEGKVTPEALDYSIDEFKSTPTEISWKSDDKNLVKKQPRQISADEDGAFDGDHGSFFCFFGDEEDQLGVGHILANEVLPNAYDYFTGEADDAYDDDEDEDELDDEEDEDDEGSVDLEDDEDQPKKKKQKV